ncbi:hypothetical protein [Streptomyces sp. NPDC057910]|uniref:hypothetical protein n=1 Tax=Streptomyces sp. NPDC057910 TaxID=3346278 RepID=UPI0036E00CDE
MGYTTEFDGKVTITPPLNPSEIAYLRQFAETRRMRRANGPYYIDGTGPYGQGFDADVTDGNRPPEGQPGLWCQWTPTSDGSALVWDGMEKFYEPVAWMSYVIEHFLKPGAVAAASNLPYFADFTFDHVVDGVIDAQGEDPDDVWQLTVVRNSVARVEDIGIDLDDEDDDLVARIDMVLADFAVSEDAMRWVPAP